ncbi:MAG: hypothetical protein F4X59_00805 [Holophagales bacterium]|nr:hypothetical protein [Holophagales bacterium]MXX60464.1 hypothetical protein [Holophagales bacterium]MYC08646.1 hypothetical protein [Holophagales bacterium]MYD23499.1 hypothetical protein [Holophagales bacterium]MYI31433.1 hypothetical protein [Holophagales bacterium]
MLIADSRRHKAFQSFGILRSLSSQLPIALAKAQLLPEDLAPACIRPDDRAATVEADETHLSLIQKDLGKGWR